MSAELEIWASVTAGLHFRDDLIRVVRLRNEARDRATQRQRRHAYAATGRVALLSDTPDETKIRRDTAVLHNKLTRLETAGKLRWDQRTRNWVVRPVFTRNDQNRPPVYTTDELLDKFDKVRCNRKGWTSRCPAHDDKTPSLSISEGDRGWLIKCWAGCDFEDIVDAAGVDLQRMFFS
jgi:hypothetical protein